MCECLEKILKELESRGLYKHDVKKMTSHKVR